MLLPAASLSHLPSKVRHARFLAHVNVHGAGGGCMHAELKEAQDAAAVCILSLLVPRVAFPAWKDATTHRNRTSICRNASCRCTSAAGLGGSSKIAGSCMCATSGVTLGICLQSRRLQSILHLLTMLNQRQAARPIVRVQQLPYNGAGCSRSTLWTHASCHLG
jgi:hypothetical protein